ncbi:MAG: metallophosphoesterase [Myxococcales bacterium]|nr:metallophosphoesterase [Myxococcales bacterium]
MKLAWLTDIHLDCTDEAGADALVAEVRASEADAVLLGGDIAEGGQVVRHLGRLDDALQRPLHFVLGNHDYYGGSVAAVRERVEGLCRERENLRYLSRSSWIALTPELALLGHDGWADGREGDFAGSPVVLNDYLQIEDLKNIDQPTRAARLAALGAEAAEHVARELGAALERHERALLLTHVPPLRGACWYQGQTADDDWAPHFVCRAVGEAILETMARHPERALTVLCGHTHSPGEARPLDNVHILTGAAEYGEPRLCRLLELP